MKKFLESVFYTVSSAERRVAKIDEIVLGVAVKSALVPCEQAAERVIRLSERKACLIRLCALVEEIAESLPEREARFLQSYIEGGMERATIGVCTRTGWRIKKRVFDGAIAYLTEIGLQEDDLRAAFGTIMLRHKKKFGKKPRADSAQRAQ